MRFFYLIFLILIATLFSPAWAHEENIFKAKDTHMAELVEKVKRSTMAIGTYYFNDKPATRFSGTGFVIGDGTRIVTNHHVIKAVKDKDRLFHLRVFHKDLPDKGIKARLAAEDPFHDLAIVVVERKLPALPLAKTGSLKEGHHIAFTGYPIGFVLGLNPTTHTGIVSAIAPIILPSPHGSLIKGELIKHLKDTWDIVQLDAVAFPGNSGSPVYRIATKNVVGVINKVFIKGKKKHVLKDPTGLTYAIPVEFVHLLNSSIKD